MRKYTILLILGILITNVVAEESLIPQLEQFKPFLEKKFKGEMSTSTAEKKQFDVQQWERILNGTAIRIMHSLNDGMYGGETILFWDTENEIITYYYFTTAGFFTHGTMTVENEKYIGHEYVEGNAQDITEVKSISEFMEDGSIKATSLYLKNGEWVKGHEIIYKEEADAELIFK